MIPAGRAFDGRTVFLLDETGADITESGKTGEICVAGESLADGYYHNEEKRLEDLSQEQFRAKQETQDFTVQVILDILARMRIFYFAGRKDFQIKHMGHRIELEEIERAFEKLDGVSRCCCLFDTKRNKLLGFYTGDMDEKEVHQELKRFLPIYMIPLKIRRIEEMPLNKNGKIDRKYLAQGVELMEMQTKELRKAAEFGDTFVCVSEEELRETTRRLENTLGKAAGLCYAMKANPFLGKGDGAACRPYRGVCSMGELQYARSRALHRRRY